MRNPFDSNELVLMDGIAASDILRWFPRRPVVKILVVADTSVSFTSSFGVGKVIDVIRENVDGYVHFEVDLARLGTKTSTMSVNPSPGPKDPKFMNFRFSSQTAGHFVVDDYDEVWCFGFAPGNDGSSNDANITNSPYASTDDDLEILTKWMNNGGGVLAMGDHHYLGAAMCSRIPRVSSMRRWTNAQGVPPIDGPGRLDTHRPENAAQDPTVTPSPAVIPFNAQSDSVPQVIQWKKYPLVSPFHYLRRHRPHPLLCGGKLGVIDVLPDHNHEGWVYDDDEIDGAKTYTFNGATGDEYPTVAGAHPMPEAIAWANTLPDPPYNHVKGPSPAKHFAVIGVYDGDPANVGRVAVDSTWHHWFDVNVVGLEAEAPDTDYQKIIRYFRNCAVWLAREKQRSQMLLYSTFWSSLKAVAYEDLVIHDSIFSLGRKAIDVIGRMTSECLVRDWLDIFVPDRLVQMLERPPFPLPDPCWSCPPYEILHEAVMGGIVKELLPLRDELHLLPSNGKAKVSLSEERFATALTMGVEAGMKEYFVAVRDNLRGLEKLANLGVEITRAPVEAQACR